MNQHVNTRCRNTISQYMQVLYLQHSWYIGKSQFLTLHKTQDPCRTEPWLLESSHLRHIHTHTLSQSRCLARHIHADSLDSQFWIHFPVDFVSMWKHRTLKHVNATLKPKKQSMNECQWLQTLYRQPPKKIKQKQIQGFQPVQFTISKILFFLGGA